MIKKTFVLITAIVLLFLIFNGVQDSYSVETKAAIEKKKPEVKIKPENQIAIAHTEIFEELERPQVIFDHNKHTEALKEEGCDECHPVDEEDYLHFEFPPILIDIERAKDEDAVMNAYHDECIGCHKKRMEEEVEEGKEEKKAGPITCGDCHVKELEFVKVEYPIFEFDFQHHDKHIKELKIKDDCSQCHHIYNREIEETVYEIGKELSCYYCHELGLKRGPKLAVETRNTEEKWLDVRKVSHERCLNCHVEYEERGEEKVGPLVCTKCHEGKYRTVAELEKIPRPDSDQPEKPFIDIKDAKLKGVLFDHTNHEKNNKTCRGCHHETLNACKDCHDLIGTSDGKWVNTANAYHDIFSEHSCAGCHGIKKTEKDCAGCHYYVLPMDLDTKDPKKETCALCHTGKKELPTPPPLRVDKLDPETVKKEVEIKILEKEYKPAKFPHLDIIKKLVKISNDNKMARYFHAEMQTICDGCHHQSRAEAEAKKDTPPYCRNCHSITFDPQRLNRPRLLAAYHRQCMDCHEQMELEKPKECKECHEEKDERPKYIFSKPARSKTQEE